MDVGQHPPAPAAPSPKRRAGLRGGPWSGIAFLDLCLVFVVLGVIWGGMWLHLAEQRREISERATQTSMNLARAAAEDIARTVAGIDQSILFLRTAYADAPDHFDVAAWASRIAVAGQPVFQYSITDPQGRLLQSSLGHLGAPMDLSDREHVRVHLDAPDDTLFISKPVLGRVSGRWSLQFTRKIVGTDGRFLGVAILSADPEWLASLYRELDLGQGSLGLMGLDGILRARAPGGQNLIGRSVAGTSLFRQASRQASGTLETISPIDGAERVMSFQRVPGYPLIVTVGLDERDVFAAFDRYRGQYLVAATGLSLLAVAVGLLLLLSRQRLLRSRRDLGAAIENIGQALVMLGPGGNVAVINRKALELLGPAPAIGAGQLATGRHEEVRPDGRVLDVRTQRLPEGGAVRTYTDVTARQEAERRIRHLAGHDVLTGLANRMLLDDRLAEMLAEAARQRREVAVFVLDLDRFRAVNDSFGHVTGDRVLVEIAERLLRTAGPRDLIARTGGDEFVIVAPELPSPDAMPARIQRLLAALAEPVQAGFQRAFVSASLGAAWFPADGTTAIELLQRAQAALERAKADGRGGWRRFEPEMELALQRRRMIERDLRAAIGSDQIALHFQPRVRLADGAVTCMEALLRWTHPEHGPIAPAAFIPIAEESGLIHPLGAWALRAGCAQARRWPGELRVSVNISISQVRGGEMPALVSAVLAETGLPAPRLELEVTESLLMDDAEQARRALGALRDMGVRLALDDFGTGYSSLSYLRTFPFDEIKIDRSFVQALDGDKGARAIVQAIIAMGRGMDLGVTAEGVETEAQMRVLRALGCGGVQGFLPGRPMQGDEVPAYLARAVAGC
jgi:diguanylate cyclase (GGDEF)-like protein